jgi:hypothetical protein
MSLDGIVLNIAPELSAVNSTIRTMFENYAITQVNFGDTLQQLATAYLAAHMMTISQRQGVGGQITSQREGDLAISFEPIVYMGGYEQTSYGVEFVRLRRMFVSGFMTRIQSCQRPI